MHAQQATREAELAKAHMEEVCWTAYCRASTPVVAGLAHWPPGSSCWPACDGCTPQATGIHPLPALTPWPPVPANGALQVLQLAIDRLGIELTPGPSGQVALSPLVTPMPAGGQGRVACC